MLIVIIVNNCICRRVFVAISNVFSVSSSLIYLLTAANKPSTSLMRTYSALSLMASAADSPVTLGSVLERGASSALRPFLSPCRIVELFGSRSGGKLLYTHSLLAGLLSDERPLPQFRVWLFDYAHQFSTQCLLNLLAAHTDLSVGTARPFSDSRRQEEVAEARLDRIRVQDVTSLQQVLDCLRPLAAEAEQQAWAEFRAGRQLPAPLFLLLDAGSLLYQSASTAEGLLEQEQLFGLLDRLSRAGALALLLNHAGEEEAPALGRGWRGLVKHRFFFDRDQQGHFYRNASEGERDGRK